jgi:hypothetical protein
MIRLRRWFVPGGCIILTVMALLSVHKPKLSMAADKPDKQEWLVDRSLTLTPRPEPVPALKYRLFPRALEMKEGNAVPIYLRLVHERHDETLREWREAAEWGKLALDQLPVQKARKFFTKYAYMMKQLDLGAQRKNAEWNYTMEQGDPISMLLPDAQWMRVYGGLLVLKARVEIAEGRYAAAAHTLQTGFAFGRHVSQGPFLISSLVGVALAVQLTDALVDWVSRSGAPNLYWSLAALPRPLIDIRRQMEFEQGFVEMQFPVLADLKRARAPAEWDAALKEFRTELNRLTPLGADGEGKKSNAFPPLRKRGPTDPAAESPELPAAREYLVKRLHLPTAQVKAMPPAQVLLLYIKGVNDEFRDDTFKAAHLPLPEAIPVFEATEKRLKAAPDTEANRMPRLLLPAINKVGVTTNRLERRIAALRIIEALRLYAAAHEGKLPDKLGDITEVPVPKDPGTAQPFQYWRDNQKATLIAPPLKVRSWGRASIGATGQRYRLTMTRK